MKRLLTLAMSLLSLSVTAQTVASMNELNAVQKAAATNVKLTGKLSTGGNSDFRQLRDLCYQLRSIDLGSADCEAIPNNAFHSRHVLEQVVLPENVRSIGSQAFFACTALNSIELPKTLTRVGDAAFSGCTKLRDITINGTPTLGEFAFARLSGLRTLRVNSAVPPVTSASTFEGIDRKKVKLVVPRGSEMKYRRAEGWNRFFGTPDNDNRLCNPAEALVPVPAHLEMTGGNPLSVNRLWEVMAADGLANECVQAERLLRERLPKIKNPVIAGKATLTLGIDTSLADDEAYTLVVSEKGVTIQGRTARGVFYGLMTFDQLLRGNGTSVCCESIPQLRIADQPRTHIRELMLDPCRTFIPFDELKAFVPEMARYKYNTIHLHLTDDQAWRIEIKKYPELTAQASARVGMDDMMVPISGYYTQKQMREFVDYAAQYHIQVVPEIEMPGHEVAAIHVFPELTCGAKQVPIRTTCGVSNELLCPGSEFTFEFLGNVFKELADIFPSPYIHLGGDEAGNPALNCWTDCPKCQALKRQLGITTTDRSENWRLQEYMFNRVIDTLRTKYGKTPMFWYETDFKKIQPGCVTFAWRHGLTKRALEAAVANNAKIMLCPGEHCYFDYPMAPGDMPEVNWGMPIIPLKRTYELDPAWGMGSDFEQNNLFGVAGTLWSECINTPERIYYQAYPRALALAEVGWSPVASRSWEGFLKRLSPVLKDMMRRGITFSMQY
ncbi:family 20 glycosylhydrolase [Prevotellamassilia timonensis]|uniref:family 20 glycosylhydrolase n=1 Tax=Prevotellamassilia timonensis TaxID=1852370 RepID=UPI0030770A09